MYPTWRVNCNKLSVAQHNLSVKSICGHYEATFIELCMSSLSWFTFTSFEWSPWLLNVIHWVHSNCESFWTVLKGIAVRNSGDIIIYIVKLWCHYIICLLVSGSVSGNQHTKFLYVNERLSRGPSIMLDNSSRSSREPRLNPVAARLHNTKKGTYSRQKQFCDRTLIQTVYKQTSAYTHLRKTDKSSFWITES